MVRPRQFAGADREGEERTAEEGPEGEQLQVPKGMEKPPLIFVRQQCRFHPRDH